MTNLTGESGMSITSGLRSGQMTHHHDHCLTWNQKTIGDSLGEITIGEDIQLSMGYRMWPRANHDTATTLHKM